MDLSYFFKVLSFFLGALVPAEFILKIIESLRVLQVDWLYRSSVIVSVLEILVLSELETLPAFFVKVKESLINQLIELVDQFELESRYLFLRINLIDLGWVLGSQILQDQTLFKMRGLQTLEKDTVALFFAEIFWLKGLILIEIGSKLLSFFSD